MALKTASLLMTGGSWINARPTLAISPDQSMNVSNASHFEAVHPATGTTLPGRFEAASPDEVRDLLGIAPGSSVTFEMADDGRVVLRKVDSRARNPRPPSRFARLRGSATAGLTTDEIMALTRGND